MRIKHLRNDFAKSKGYKDWQSMVSFHNSIGQPLDLKETEKEVKAYGKSLLNNNSQSLSTFNHNNDFSIGRLNGTH